MRNAVTEAAVTDGVRVTARTLIPANLRVRVRVPVLNRILTLIRTTTPRLTRINIDDNNEYADNRQLLIKYHAERKSTQG